MRILIRFTLVAAITLAASYCGRMSRSGPAEPGEPTIVVVDNQSTVQVTVYVLRDAHRQRLGVANALTATRLRIPDTIIFGPTSLRFEVHPLGSRHEPISESITVARGQEVRLLVPPTIR
jgi:hypothetical protein